jgi:prepilin-type N-terminal cleavage/methylation domain-containing protein
MNRFRFFPLGLYLVAGRTERRTKRARPSIRRVGGFTLLEVMSVVAIIAIMSGIAVYSINTNLDRIRADTAVRRVSIALSYARIRAIAEDCNYIVTFRFRASSDPGHAKCYIEMVADTNKNGVKDAGETTRTEDLPKGVVYELKGYHDIHNIEADSSDWDGIAFPGNTVTFLPRGNATTKGEVYMIPEQSLKKGINDLRRAVSLEKLSGRTIPWFYHSSLAAGGKNPWEKEGR